MGATRLAAPVLVAFLVSSPVPTRAESAATAIVHVDVLNLDDGTRQRDQTVIVQGEKISFVGPAKEGVPPLGSVVVDGRGRILIPGLCDMHVHVRNDPGDDFKLYLANGVTTIRNMSAADGGWDHLALREKVRTGKMLGPRYLVAGPFVDEESAGGVGALVKLLHEYETRRYDFIKVHGELSPDVFETLLAESERLGIPVVGHAQRERALVVSLRMKSISHMEEFLYLWPWSAMRDSSRRAGLAKIVAARGVAVAPTLRIYEIIEEYLDDAAFAKLATVPAADYLPAESREEWLSDRNEYRDPSGGFMRFMMSALSTDDMAETRRLAAGRTHRRFEVMKRLTFAMQRAGVLLIAGSDGFGMVVPGLSLHEELETLVDAGLTPLEALRTSTINVARYLGEEDRSGSVSEGKVADLVLLGADPTVDIANARIIEGVMARGRWLGRRELDAMSQGVIRNRGRARPPKRSDPGSQRPR